MAERGFAGDDGRVVAITGAGKGLGAAFARAWSRRGAKLILNNRRRDGEPSSADALVAELGGNAVAEYSDIAAPDAADAIVAAALSHFGRLDALILNAGISGPAARIADLDEATIRDVMAVNFHANAALARAALPHLAASGTGRLLFVSSSAGLHGVRGRAAYAASKGALNAYALTLADEVRRDGIGVNILAPFAATPMTAGVGGAAHPALSPDNAAPAAVWLTSAACPLTGEVWVAGGGRFRRARTVESVGVGHPAATPEWLSDNAAAIADMTGAREYRGAEAAFADLFADATDHEERRCAG